MGQISKILSDALWEKKYLFGIRQINKIVVVNDFDRESKYCALGILYDHLVSSANSLKKKSLEAIARKMYKNALRINKNSTGAMVGFGRILLHKKDVRALRWYKMALEVTPRDTRLLFAYAVACSSLGRFDEAEHFFKRLWKRKGASFDYAYNLASLEFRRGNQRKAAYYARIALRLFVSLSVQERRSKGGRAFRAAMTDLAKTWPLLPS